MTRPGEPMNMRDACVSKSGWHAHAALAMLLVLGLDAHSSAFAVTWSEREITDPVSDVPCRVQSLASSGSYL